MIFFMQCGFAMLCAGSVRQKNVKNIMLKNILDACGGAVGFWSVGHALANGTGGRFVGAQYGLYFLNDDDDYISFFFQFTFAATAATIVAGTVAERCKMSAYVCYSLFLTAFVYPVVVHAIWNSNGFLTTLVPEGTTGLFGIGMIDFAGSGVVHMTGGATALVAAVVLGPRIGRFYNESGELLENPVSFPPHSVALQVLGTFILWFGWYGFNPGSTLAIINYGDTTALCAVTTTLAAATGCASALFIDTMIGFVSTGDVEYDTTMAMNGALSGLVSITANCSVVEPWAALMIGLVAGLVYVSASQLLIKLKIDDAVDAIPVHLFNGMWGCIATGIFASPRFVAKVYGVEGGGLLYGEGGNLLACECLGILFIIGWTFGLMFPFFVLLKNIGWFRVDPLEEMIGLDIYHHKGAAYDLSGPNQDDVATYKASKSMTIEDNPHH